MTDHRATAPPAPGIVARTLAARLAAHGYQVRFPPGRDPATFKMDGLPGDPDVEVSAEEDGWTSCYYTGRSRTEAARVIARLPVPGHPQAQAAIRSTLTATWDGIEVEWHCLPPHGRPSDLDQAASALLAHLAVLDDGRYDDGEDDPR